MDEYQIERAALREQQERDAALQSVMRAAAPETHPDFDGEHCVSCDEPIPAARLALARVRCVACQRIKEKSHAHKS